MARLLPNVTVATTRTTASAVPAIADRTGTEVRPRPGSSAKRIPTTAGTGNPEAVAALAPTDVRSVRRTTRQAWQQEPLPPAQSELLRLAAGRPGITVADAAQELHLAPNTVSTLVGRLTGFGLLGHALEMARGSKLAS